MERGRRIILAACAACVTLAGCGGGPARQDADEPSGTWRVSLPEAKFPRSQHVAEKATMRITVRNDADKAMPNVAVTVDSFSARSEQAGLASAERPIWVVDNGPRGGVTAYANTWALGRVPPGGTRTFEWQVTAVQPGRHRISYRVAAGLDGKAKARLDGGSRPEGRFDVNVSREPSQSRVEPGSGDVIRR